MIVVDTSALVAIAFAEPERDVFLQAISAAARALVSTVSIVECRMVIHGRRGQRAVILTRVGRGIEARHLVKRLDLA